MALSISYLDETSEVQAEELDLIKQLLNKAAEYENLSGEIEVSIMFVDNEKIRKINKQYRNMDKPTDVISFALEEQVEGEVEIVGVTLPRILGDIVISIPKAKQQAKDYNHSYRRELGFLALHGFLHLLGYDHGTEKEEQMMFQRQKEILEKHGLTR
ncbi:rRNA maturation RNase YbeY [Pueribacillus sp. YX66]|uniref:rRNA maturation RNase YbeY n=1 Tax=Pueribacillus sp. YX66 TaxID=3229242 RepID=UPI00358CFC28